MNEKIESQLKSIIYDTIKKKIIAKAVTALPFLGLKFFNPFLSYAVEKLLDVVYEEAHIFLTFTLIDINGKQRLDEYKGSIEELRKAYESKDEEQITKAVKDVEDKLANLIRFPNSR